LFTVGYHGDCLVVADAADGDYWYVLFTVTSVPYVPNYAVSTTTAANQLHLLQHQTFYVKLRQIIQNSKQTLIKL